MRTVRGILLRIEDNAYGELIVDKAFNNFSELNSFIEKNEGGLVQGRNAVLELIGASADAEGERNRVLFETKLWTSLSEQEVSDLCKLLGRDVALGSTKGIRYSENTEIILHSGKAAENTASARLAAKVFQCLESKGYGIIHLEFGPYCPSVLPDSRVIRIQFSSNYAFGKPFPIGGLYSKTRRTLDYFIDAPFSQIPAAIRQEQILAELLQWAESVNQRQDY